MIAIGMIAPATYVSAMTTVSTLGPCVIAVAMTAAMIGPTHGAQTRPIAPPRTSPPASPSPGRPPATLAPNSATGARPRSASASIRLDTSVRPTMPSTTALTTRKRSVFSPAAARAAARMTAASTKREAEPDEDADGPPSTPGGRCAKHERNDRQGARREDREHPGHESEGKENSARRRLHRAKHLPEPPIGPTGAPLRRSGGSSRYPRGRRCDRSSHQLRQARRSPACRSCP